MRDFSGIYIYELYSKFIRTGCQNLATIWHKANPVAMQVRPTWELIYEPPG